MSPDVEVQLAPNLQLLPALVAVVLVLHLVAPYRGWMTLLVALGGALATGYLWVRSLARGLRLTREMRYGWAQVGDRVEERFALTNRGVLPALWVQVADHSTMPGYRVGRVSTVGSRDSTRWRVNGACTQRGLFDLGPTSLLSSDPLGIFVLALHYPQSMPFMVMPPVVSLPGIEVAPGGRAGQACPRASTLERTVSAAMVREYVPGDSRRWIHWRSTARHGALHVRLFDSVPAGDWWILLDMDRHAQVGNGLDATVEHGVILAASLADRGLRAGKEVGLVVQGDDLVWLQPQGGEGRRYEILRALALISLGEVSLSRVLAQIGPALGRHSSLIIITPDVGGEWVKDLIPLIGRDIVPTVLLLDRDSFADGQNGSLSLPGEARRTDAHLTELGVVHYVIGPGLLDASEMRPGRRGHWEWRVTGTGRAVPVQKPQDMEWRVLA
jgi:uncharacterized protein (DUF58 family)